MSLYIDSWSGSTHLSAANKAVVRAKWNRVYLNTSVNDGIDHDRGHDNHRLLQQPVTGCLDQKEIFTRKERKG